MQRVAVGCNVYTFMYVSHANRGNATFMNNYCSVLQCVAVWCRVLQCGSVRCSVCQCAAVCCSVLQWVAMCIHSCMCRTQIVATLFL